MASIHKNWTESPLALPLALMAVVLAVSAVGFAGYESSTQAEPVGLFEGLWWACVTLFTVGYGDFAPKTVPGRVLGMAVMASGIGLVSTVTGSLASAMVERRFKKRRGLLSVKTEGHILILGWNAHGARLLERLEGLPDLAGRPVVLAADMEPSRFEELAGTLPAGLDVRFVRGAATVRQVVERTNPAKARLAYILPADNVTADEADNASVLTALTVRALAPELTLYVEALREASREHLARAGVTKVLSREELTGRTLAFMAVHPVMHDVLLALLASGEETRRDHGRIASRKGLVYRALTEAEKTLGWDHLVRASLEKGGELPLGVCRLPRKLKLSDVLDASQALDSYIMELLEASGQGVELGQQSPRVALNPGPGTDISGYDGVILLERGS